VNENLRRLEEKIAHLEHHVTQQDKAMLEFADELARLRREVQSLRERAASGVAGDPGGEADDEKPPHY
jgi:SlyX protein